MLFLQALTIIAFNNGSFNMKTLLEVLSLGPTFVVMKFIESMCHSSHFYWKCLKLICSVILFAMDGNNFLLVLTIFYWSAWTWSRCSRYSNDVWCILYFKASCCFSNFSSFYLVQYCISFDNISLCVCILALMFLPSCFSPRPLVLFISILLQESSSGGEWA